MRPNPARISSRSTRRSIISTGRENNVIWISRVRILIRPKKWTKLWNNIEIIQFDHVSVVSFRLVTWSNLNVPFSSQSSTSKSEFSKKKFRPKMRLWPKTDFNQKTIRTKTAIGTKNLTSVPGCTLEYYMVPYHSCFHIFNFCQFYVFNKGLRGHLVQTRLEIFKFSKCPKMLWYSLFKLVMFDLILFILVLNVLLVYHIQIIKYHVNYQSPVWYKYAQYALKTNTKCACKIIPVTQLTFKWSDLLYE